MKIGAFFLALAASLWIHGAQAAACADPGGIGGTGATSDGGIGGTGLRSDGGIGGTGQRAEGDIGLIGVITGFGSICVNGVEVHFDATTPVSRNGDPASANALAIGQVVSVRAFGDEVNARARSIHVAEAAVGPVTAADAAGGVVHVFGQPVRANPSTVFGPGVTRELFSAARIGETFSVSGLRAADGSIAATRIERAAPDARPGGAEPVQDVLAAGRFSVLGYVRGVPQGGELQLGNMSFSANPEIAARLASGRLVRVTGHLESDGRRVVERAEALSSALSARPESGLRSSGGRREGDDRRGGDDRGDRSGRGERSGRDDGGRPDRIDRPERPERSGSDRIERPDRSGRR